MDFSKGTMRVLVYKDYGACYDFYNKTLGFTPVFGDKNGPYTSFAVQGQREPCFAIFDAKAMAMFPGYAAPAEAKHHDGLVGIIPSQNLDEDYARLSAAGVELIGKPTQIDDWGMRLFYFRDPEGNLFEVNDAEGV